MEPTLIEPNTEFEIDLPWPRDRTAREGDPITIASQASTEIYDIISVTPDPGRVEELGDPSPAQPSPRPATGVLRHYDMSARAELWT
jgi:hypothetical protein